MVRVLTAYGRECPGRPVIRDHPVNHVARAFLNDHPFLAVEGNHRIRRFLDVQNTVCVEHESLAIQAGELNHSESRPPSEQAPTQYRISCIGTLGLDLQWDFSVKNCEKRKAFMNQELQRKKNAGMVSVARGSRQNG